MKSYQIKEGQLPRTNLSRVLRSPFNYLLLNLSVTELIISCTGNTILAINSFNRQWMFSYTACQANAFGMTYLGIQSIITLAVLALQRFMMVTQDRQFPLSTTISSTVTLMFIWLYTLACALPPLLGWGTFSVNTLKVSCGVKWKPGAQSPALQMSYIAYIYCLGFIIPIIIIFTSYIKIIKTIKNSGNFPLSMSQSVRRGKLERDRRITRMVAIMLGSYLIIWFPYACTSIAEAAGYTPKSDGEYYLYALPTMLTKANVCVDPLIYFGFNPQFQHEMKRKLFSHREGSWGEMVSFNSFASHRRNKNSTVNDV